MKYEKMFPKFIKYFEYIKNLIDHNILTDIYKDYEENLKSKRMNVNKLDILSDSDKDNFINKIRINDKNEYSSNYEINSSYYSDDNDISQNIFIKNNNDNDGGSSNDSNNNNKEHNNNSNYINSKNLIDNKAPKQKKK